MRRLLCNGYGKNIGVSVFLTCLTLGFCYLFCLRYGVFGANVDWISQHSVLPDYFRRQFYDTGQLFPEFAANIGGGQNIYHFSYYGLYNPVLLPSYLLPFVKMSDYMMAVQLLSLTASVLLMYQWLRRRGFSEKICVGTAVLFLLSGPVIFHSYNQIMFVNYMPFLLMGMKGVDRYFEDNRQAMLTVSIFLMIMTSFYFSIGGMLALALYGLHRYLMVCEEKEVQISLKSFFDEGIRFCVHFVLAVMMSGILLAPTAFSLIGRGGEGVKPDIWELLIPKMSMGRFCYSPYGIGMTSLAVTALIAMLAGRKWYERVLALSCLTVLTVPVFAYLLNGGLYVRDKVMIPFLPLLCYILSYYLDGQEREAAKETGEHGVRRRLFGSLPYVLTLGLICLDWQQENLGKYGKLMLLDGILLLACYLFLAFGRIRWASLAPLTASILMLAVSDHVYHVQADRALDRGFYEEMTDPGIGEMITDITDSEEGFYRTEQLGNDTENAANLNRIWSMGQYSSSVYSSSYHEGYREFRDETFQLEEPFRNFLMQPSVHNPVYQRFMGIKYVVSKEAVPGYEKIQGNGEAVRNGEADSRGGWKVYRNDQVSPIAYGTDRVIAEEDYRKLKFPYNQLALLKAAVVKEAQVSAELTETVRPVELGLPKAVDSVKDNTVQVRLPDPQNVTSWAYAGAGERVLFLKFQIRNRKPSKDVAVWVDGIRNKLTAESHFYYNKNTEFTYAVPLEDGQESVEITFGKGKYEIADVQAFLGELPVRDATAEDGLYQSVFRPDLERTKGNRIAGTIDAKSPGYFITTIPYEENFEILMDGRTVEGEVVNAAFLGFRMEAGKHEVEIIYHAPGVKAGKLLSAAGALWFLLLYLVRHRRVRNV